MRTGPAIRRLPSVFAVVAAGAVALAGCSAGGTNLNMATGSTGGTYYPLGGEIAEVWSDNIEGVNVSTQASGASVENMHLLDQDETELVMAVNGVAASAAEGTSDFEEESLSEPGEIRALGNVYPEVMQIVATEESGIETVEDLEGQRVDIGPAGSGTEVAARQILEAYGISIDDVTEFQSDFEDAASNLSDGQVDAAFAILAVPASSIEQVATGTDVNLVEISGEPAEQLIAEDESYSVMEIEGGTYQGVDEPVETLTNWATLYTKADLDEEVAYNLTKEMYEGAGSIGHDVGGDIQLETALDGLGPIELHPGAERYYQEEGELD
ncbi:TAXI family TRAP transporter solute-binding subunit [Allosalinactinospora lopnorensis]|uniref:TAXI family TRAP transporter solute-binding subunit n=1 Tax=Allosalinactinospora lopnorensis TaxID=1352348 RepID=UPI000ABE80A0|nr:TAXI family TRAP transporter solute-binding subunit [Allosalinactinospora lopnorensis]